VSDLAKKLGIKASSRVCLLAAPAPAEAVVRQACQDVLPRLIFEQDLERCDVILFWPHSLLGLTDQLRELQNRIYPDGAIWVVMPKKKFARERGIDFTWEQMQAAGLLTDLVDNKVAAITEQDYGTRFVIRKGKRR